MDEYRYVILVIVKAFIAGVAVALKQAQSPQFLDYAKNVLENAKILCDDLIEYGYTLVTG